MRSSLLRLRSLVALVAASLALAQTPGPAALATAAPKPQEGASAGAPGTATQTANKTVAPPVQATPAAKPAATPAATPVAPGSSAKPAGVKPAAVQPASTATTSAPAAGRAGAAQNKPQAGAAKPAAKLQPAAQKAEENKPALQKKPAAGVASPKASKPIPAASAPAFPPQVVFRPSFITPNKAHFFGLSFRLRDPQMQADFLVSTHRCFGPAAELETQMSPNEVAKVVVAAVGVAIEDPNHLVIARPYVGPMAAAAGDDKGYGNDISLFMLLNPMDEPALLLDPALSLAGDRVWVVVKYPRSSRVGLEAATVTWVGPEEIQYLFDNPKAELEGISGTAVLSSEGTVVGMHIGSIRHEGEKLYGFSCPSACIARALDTLRPQEPAPAPAKKDGQAAPRPKKSLMEP